MAERATTQTPVDATLSEDLAQLLVEAARRGVQLEVDPDRLLASVPRLANRVQQLEDVVDLFVHDTGRIRDAKRARRAWAGRAAGARKTNARITGRTKAADRRLEQKAKDLLAEGHSIRSTVKALRERGIRVGRDKIAKYRRS